VSQGERESTGRANPGTCGVSEEADARHEALASTPGVTLSLARPAETDAGVTDALLGCVGAWAATRDRRALREQLLALAESLIGEAAVGS
jgi:hypothetical protein